ncbi:aurora kinase A and ninein-interacting protein [Echinops telfairi]|uniref:Aurora kinase A and ninein-interacting protein n=1 Tax=Echinops telfairi TaxID=9371 RepID=A0ABM0ZR50_ECHTE|nr:aurora kinase A and ninein-interacting protein [Echinops telfairi]
MLTLFPGERQTRISCTQRSAPPAGIRQTSITSFFTLQPGKPSDGDQTSVSTYRESQTSKESKKDAAQLEYFLQSFQGDCVAFPLANSTPVDIQDSRLSPQSLQETSGHQIVESTYLSALPLPHTPVCGGGSKTSLKISCPQDLKCSSLKDQKKGKGESSEGMEWLHGSKEKSYLDAERRVKLPVGKCCQPVDKIKLQRKVSTKESRQFPALQTYRDSWSGKNTMSVKQSPCLVPVFSRDSERRDKVSWSQLFTEDSQGQRVIAHSPRAPFQDITNDWDSHSPPAQCQDGPTPINLQPNLLFTQDSEGNQVIRHQF